eukprot:CAMPEP_0181316642 /NCGR_PEP_ID=MMETSP1101-20121128/16006_1 /TAXON_ID=46948 /ORGANISM="Rhodomonas abbreviata, Strain Caron Lab Isolate" /LENGTH=199 /DNA_ID=CAMNT_0023423907 /DNA_START=97 /DNA_END=692 /DNA_ORIENTATION=+
MIRQRGAEVPRRAGQDDDASGKGSKGGADSSLFPFLPGGRRAELMAGIILLLVLLLGISLLIPDETQEIDDDFPSATPPPEALRQAGQGGPQPLDIYSDDNQPPPQAGLGGRYGRGRGVPIEPTLPSDPDAPPIGDFANDGPQGATDPDPLDPNMPPLDDPQDDLMLDPQGDDPMLEQQLQPQMGQRGRGRPRSDGLRG